jgi:hypothetical protein
MSSGHAGSRGRNSLVRGLRSRSGVPSIVQIRDQPLRPGHAHDPAHVVPRRLGWFRAALGKDADGRPQSIVA